MTTPVESAVSFAQFAQRRVPHSSQISVAELASGSPQSEQRDTRGPDTGGIAGGGVDEEISREIASSSFRVLSTSSRDSSIRTLGVAGGDTLGDLAAARGSIDAAPGFAVPSVLGRG